MIKMKKKYIVVFLIKEQNSFSRESKKRVSSNIEKIRYNKKKTFPIDISKPTFTAGLKLFYFINTTDGKQIHFIKVSKEDRLNAEVMDMIFEQEIIKQLTSNLGDKSAFKANLTNIILGAIIGLGVGFILATYLTKFGIGFI